ncbi:DUF3152 domain-containing protein [Actinoplanes sp. NPDC051470]|uniref:DUF3152 domain-containing protein n=1 Tax=unclassified Actinoplanes TaxID=2626549 RepID=UPI00342B1691
MRRLVGVVGLVMALGACSQAVDPPRAVSGSAAAPRPVVASAPPVKPSPTVPTDRQVPRSGAGTYAVAGGDEPAVGTGRTVITYRVEVEKGIKWGSLEKVTPADFAAEIERVLSDKRGWEAAAKHPITDKKQGLKKASWKFKRVSGSKYKLRIRLATPDTADRLCAAIGLNTAGKYSCKFENTVVINLRRWLQGAPKFPVTVDEYHAMVINHEMGHALGFNHQGCPGKGKPAPAMMQQTIKLDGCRPNVWPFAADGRFITGPWQPS